MINIKGFSNLFSSMPFALRVVILFVMKPLLVKKCLIAFTIFFFRCFSKVDCFHMLSHILFNYSSILASKEVTVDDL